MRFLEDIKYFLKNNKRGPGLVLILAAVIWAYFPSLYHLPRVDHWAYLEKVSSRHDWYALAVKSFALNREVIGNFPSGDEHCFRPVLYFLLGNEKFFFGNNFFLWQGLGILLHLLVVAALYRFLWRIRPGFQASAAAAFFALMLGSSETVIWQHINAYVLFGLLVLLAVERLYVFSLDKKRKDCLWVAALLMAVASFNLEAGGFYAFCMFLYVYFSAGDREGRRLSFLFLLVPFIYVFASVLNYKLMGCHSLETMSGQAVWASCVNVVQKFFFVLKWQLSAFFLVKDDVYIQGRLATLPQVLTWCWPFNSWAWERIFATAALLSAAAWCALACKWKRSYNKSFLVLLAGLILVYTVTLTLGRVGPRGIVRGLINCLYYLYNFWLLATVLLYMLCSSFEPVLTGRWRRVLSVIAGALFLVFVFYQAAAIHKTNQDCAILGERFIQQKVHPDSVYYKHFTPERLTRSLNSPIK
jgi:hypothetical protein